MTQAMVQPYLFFGGRCDEALEFYRTAIGAEVKFLMRHRDSPDAHPPGMLQPGFEDKVMHVTFQVGASTLMASDGCDDKSTFAGFSLSLQMPTPEAAEQAFARLSEGGEVQMPLTQTFWSSKFGMVRDRFGIGWMVTVPQPA